MKGNSLPAGLVFDMDGVLVDSNPYHLQKWVAFLDAHRVTYNAEELPNYVLGHRNDVAFRYFFGPQVTEAEMDRLSEELEEWFRRAFKPHAKPVPGLRALVEECYRAGIPMAVASSAMSKNVEFVVGALGWRKYFRSLLTGDEVTHPKPHPEIYLKTAERLNLAPSTCVAFEDSFVGIESAKDAGMKCVAIASTFPREELERHGQADLLVGTFEDLSLARLRRLFQG
jgi:HAD superfamily hydrolase (TIGR01509 family)